MEWSGIDNDSEGEKGTKKMRIQRIMKITMEHGDK